MQNSPYNVVLHRMMLSYVENSDWNGLADYMEKLTHAQFRTAGAYMSGGILTNLPSRRFWACFLSIVERNPKAYLMTFLKAAVENYKAGGLELEDPSFLTFCRRVADNGRAIDERKTMQTLLPILQTPGEVENLFNAFGVEDTRQRVSYLMNAETMASYFVLFNQLRELDHDKAYLQQCCTMLKRKDTRLAYNMVSILKRYFDLPNVKGQFSLKMDPFELSRMERGYEAFTEKMSSI